MNAEASAKAKHGEAFGVFFGGFGAAKNMGGFPRCFVCLRLWFFQGSIYSKKGNDFLVVC